MGSFGIIIRAPENTVSFVIIDGGPDLDDDGVVGEGDNCRLSPNPLQENFDNDPFGDHCDPDDDNDQVPDDEDDLPFDPTETVDTDGDGIGKQS